ncbi:MAG: pectinesterase family protein [Gallionellaceae bacterium]|nr:pectinesterase family protein [Gallionellaceae bacterium]
MTAFWALAGVFATQACLAAAGRVVVAASGGDYTTISAALNAINPSASNPYEIEVLPGTYVENVTLKSYVHLKGAGREVTFIQSPNGNTAVNCNGITNVAISGFSLANSGEGISIAYGTNVTIANNIISGNGTGIMNYYGSAVEITNNIISNNSFVGLRLAYAQAAIKNNTITGNTYHGGIWVSYASAGTIIQGNVITNNEQGIAVYGTENIAPSQALVISDNTVGSLTLDYPETTALINHNTITGGIYVADGGTWPAPVINLNTVDGGISGTRAVGGGNYNSAGSAVVVP